MSMIERIKEKARADRKTIVFPEGLEPRTVKACAILKAEGIADPVLLGKPEDILREAEELHADLTGIRIVDPEFDAKFSEYAETLYELRKMKGMTREKAAEVAKDPMYFGIMMVKCGDAGMRTDWCPERCTLPGICCGRRFRSSRRSRK